MSVQTMPVRLGSTLTVCASLLLAACGGGSQPPAEPPAAETPAPAAAPALTPLVGGWTATDGIETPESVYYDAASGFIFASQIAGMPDGRDGNGRIVKLGGDGQVVSSTFVTGLNAPKGLRAHNGILWTADLDEVIGFNIATGAVQNRVKIAGAMFLNDVAVDRMERSMCPTSWPIVFMLSATAQRRCSPKVNSSNGRMASWWTVTG